MKLSPAAEFAVRGALVLAERGGKGPVTLETICSQRDLPRQYLVKIFSLLTKAGIITPVRGKRGGYLLAHDPASITLLEIIEAIEGPVALNFCQRTPPQCDRLNCAIRPIWSELQKNIRSRLGSMTLVSCLGDGKPPRKT
ncbi:MAG: Rrf2 family transcriptional regulator [Alphaproteobacteria bacterium]